MAPAAAQTARTVSPAMCLVVCMNPPVRKTLARTDLLTVENTSLLRGLRAVADASARRAGAYNPRMLSWVCALLAVGTLLAPVEAAGPAPGTVVTLLDRFLSRVEEPPVEYRALRHFEASNPHFRQSATMDVWTEFDHAKGFRYEVVSESGSSYIRKK